jgi:hypothetical protein
MPGIRQTPKRKPSDFVPVKVAAQKSGQYPWTILKLLTLGLIGGRKENGRHKVDMHSLREHQKRKR